MNIDGIVLSNLLRSLPPEALATWDHLTHEERCQYLDGVRATMAQDAQEKQEQRRRERLSTDARMDWRREYMRCLRLAFDAVKRVPKRNAQDEAVKRWLDRILGKKAKKKT